MSELTSNLLRSKNLESLLDNFTRLKRDAYAKLDQALSVDQTNDSNETKMRLYESCLPLINKASVFYIENHDQLHSNEDAIKIYQQLNEMKRLTVERLEYLKKTTQKPVNSDINDEEFLNISDDVLLVDDEDSDVIIIDSPNKSDRNKSLKDFAKATEIYRLENGVRQFFIATDGTVSTPSHSTDISIYTFENNLNEKDGKNIVGFVKVADWLYPLTPNESPGMKTNFNAYIFPNKDKEMNDNTNANAECSFIGVTFDKKISNDQIMFFEDILASYHSLIYQDTTQQDGIKKPLSGSATSDAIANTRHPKENSTDQSKSKSVDQINKSDKAADADTDGTPKNSLKSSFTAENIASTLITGAQYISRGVNSTTDYANKYLQQGSEKIVEKIEPNQQAAKVDPALKTAVSTLRYGSHLTVRVSSFLVDKLKSIASSTAKTVAPHLKDGSTYLLKQTGVVKNSSDATSYVDSTCKVAGSAIEGFSIVYDSLEEAAKQLGRNFTEQSVTVVSHKYGPEAAKVTENSLYSIGNVAQSVNNFQSLKVMRTLAKATAKETLSSSKKSNQKAGLSSETEKK